MREVNYTAKAVKARVEHRCESHQPPNRVILPGEVYVRAVAFGQHDAYGAGRGARPWVMVHCAECSERYTDTKDLVEHYDR